MPDMQTTVEGGGDLSDAGSKTGVTDTYGADLGQDATNSMGSITGETKSDGMRQNMPLGMNW